MWSPGTVQVWVEEMVLPSGSVTRILELVGMRSILGEDDRRKWPVVPVSRMERGEDLWSRGKESLEDGEVDLGRHK